MQEFGRIYTQRARGRLNTIVWTFDCPPESLVCRERSRPTHRTLEWWVSEPLIEVGPVSSRLYTLSEDASKGVAKHLLCVALLYRQGDCDRFRLKRVPMPDKIPNFLVMVMKTRASPFRKRLGSCHKAAVNVFYPPYRRMIHL